MPARSKYLRAGHTEPDADEKGGPSDYDADEPGKRSKASVHYSKGTMEEHCGICEHFQAQINSCELVAGHIVPTYWCRLFKRAKMRGGAMTKHMKAKA